MVLARFVLLAAVLLAASSVSAAVTIDLGPSDYRKWGTGTNSHTPSGLRSTTGQTVRIPPLNGNLTVNRNAVIPYNSLANGMRNFVRITPGSAAASAAVTGLFLAVDWVFDNAAGEWRKEGTEVAPLEDNSQFGWGCNVCEGNRFAEPVEACQWIVSNVNFGGVRTLQSVQPLSPTSYSCVLERSNGTTHTISVIRTGDSCPAGFEYSDENARCERGALIELDASDWSELAGYLPSANPQQVGTAGHDTQRLIGNPLPGFADTTITGPSSVAGPETTTTTTTATGDNIVTSTQTTTNITYGDTTITTTNTTVTNTYTNGNHTSTETTTETPGELPVTEPSSGGTAGEWPGFCDWATVVCEFIEWFKEPFEEPEVEWPEIVDEDFEEEFNFNLPSSCPAPYTINLSLFPSVEFDWQPFCDLATFIRPLVLASAAIFAAFISLGIARART